MKIWYLITYVENVTQIMLSRVQASGFIGFSNLSIWFHSFTDVFHWKYLCEPAMWLEMHIMLENKRELQFSFYTVLVFDTAHLNQFFNLTAFHIHSNSYFYWWEEQDCAIMHTYSTSIQNLLWNNDRVSNSIVSISCFFPIQLLWFYNQTMATKVYLWIHAESNN